VLWIEEHYQYAMWVLGSDEEDAEESNRENQEGSVRGSPTHGGNRHLDWASRSVEEIYGAKPVQVSSGALHAGRSIKSWSPAAL
jgi:hypothetical protein